MTSTKETDSYIHLISKPSDSKGHFVNRLSESFQFDATEEVYCGLKELSISCDLASEYIAAKSDKREDQLLLGVHAPYYTLTDNFVELEIDNGYYTCQSLVNVINSRISGVLGPLFPPTHCRLWFNPTLKKIEFNVNGKDPIKGKKVTLVIFASVSKILGIQAPNDPIPKNYIIGADSSLLPGAHSLHQVHAVCKFPPLIKNFDLIIVYLSILKRVNVGDQLVQVSDILPKSDCIPGHAYLNFRIPAPKYIKLSSNLRSIEKIEVMLATETGDLINFGKNAAETRLTLHLLSKSMLNHHS